MGTCLVHDPNRCRDPPPENLTSTMCDVGFSQLGLVCELVNVHSLPPSESDNGFKAITTHRSDTPRSDQATTYSDTDEVSSAIHTPRIPEQWGSEVTYQGELLGQMKHGTGVMRMKRCLYNGDFRYNVMHGNGALDCDDGRHFQGQFQDGMFHGFGIMTLRDGDAYCGQYVQGKKHGTGTLMWRDGRRYHGQWIVGKRHGIGAYTNARGTTRRGLWQMDLPLHWEKPNSGQDPESEARAANMPHDNESLMGLL